MVNKTEFDWDSLLACESSGILVIDTDQNVVSTNKLAEDLLQVTDGLLGRKITNLISLSHLKKFIAEGRGFSDKPAIIGSYRFMVDYVPIIEDKKITGGVFSINRETLMRKETTYDELLQVLQSVNAIVDMAYDGIIVVDAQGIITMVNQSFADVFGFDAQEMIGKHVLSAYVNSNLSRLPIVMKTGKAEIGEIHYLNGRDLVVSRYPIMKDGKAIGAIGKVLFKDLRDVAELANKIQSKREDNGFLGEKQNSQEGAIFSLNSIIGKSKQVQDLKDTVIRIASRGSNVLIRGESGTGKELFAHAIHAASNRRYGPFIKVNCAAIPEHLLESELFGYEEGAFTGAKKGGQIGKFQQAHKGTIFLDEIGDMTLSMQAKLLRVLQEREVEPLGGAQARKIDVRIVAATNVNLEDLISKNLFREDLYYRLNVVSLSIPPLRERKEDIEYLVKHLVEKYNRDFGLNICGYDDEVKRIFSNYDWPGNVRELKNIIERAFNIITGNIITIDDLPRYLIEAQKDFIYQPLEETSNSLNLNFNKHTLEDIIEQTERQVIEHALQLSNGNKAHAANLLGISRPGLYKKLQKLNMDV